MKTVSFSGRIYLLEFRQTQFGMWGVEAALTFGGTEKDKGAGLR